MLNLLDLRSIMGYPGGTPSAFTHAFWARRELHCMFLGRGYHYYVQTRHNHLFFPLQYFSRKT